MRLKPAADSGVDDVEDDVEDETEQAESHAEVDREQHSESHAKNRSENHTEINNDRATSPMSTKKLAVGIALVAALFHMGMTVAYDYPSNDWVAKDRRNTVVFDYMWPWFHQGYKLFAANPISSDRALYIKAKLKNTATEEITETEWLNFTAGEIKTISQKIRRKHPSILGAEGYMSALGSLTTKQKELLNQDFPGKEGYANLKSALNDANDNKNTSAVNSYMTNLYYINALASQAAKALFADEAHTVVEIKTKVRYTTIPRFDDRFSDESYSKEWKFQDYENGWLRLIYYEGHNEQKFKETIQGWFE